MKSAIFAINKTIRIMKKHFLVFFTLIVACLGSMSCGKEGETGEKSIVGTWVVVKEVDTMSDGTVYTYTDKNDWSDIEAEICFPYMLSYSSDGVYSGKNDLYSDIIPQSYEIKSGYIYTLSMQWAKIVSNDGKTLVLELSDGMLKLNNLFLDEGEPLVVKAVATYKKQ